ncbi:MAG: FtsX-like permease family protein [Sphingomonadales bacterium]|nr:MAG: FtsX-like permease family protein [Sphingomonadales bacterium]
MLDGRVVSAPADQADPPTPRRSHRMIRHIIASACVSFIRAPASTLANILALALGLACFLGAYGASVYWRSGDSYQELSPRTYVIGSQINMKAGGPNLGAGFGQLDLWSTSTFAKYLREDIAGVGQVARVSRSRPRAVATGEAKQMLHAAFADPSFLNVFQLDFVAGDKRDALARPNGVILTQAAAQRLFGAQSAIGQSLMIDNSLTVTVTGVIAPVHQPSFMGDLQDSVLRFDMLAAWSTDPVNAAADTRDSWANLDAYTFVVLPPAMKPETLDAGLAAMLEKRVPPALFQRASISVTALPIATMTTRKYDILLEAQFGASLSVIAAVLVLGAIALGVAIINYANLATAQAMRRAKEIGMRRVVGAGKAQIMLHSWIEATLQAALAFGVAVLLLLLMAPVVHTASGIDIRYFLTTGAGPWAVATGVVLVVALLAGAYPALVQAGVRPASAMRAGQSRTTTPLLASILVVIQFASASFLLLLVITTQLQRSHIEASVLSPREDPILYLNSLDSTGVDLASLRTELLAQPGVKHVSAINETPWSDGKTAMQLSAVRQFGRTPEQASSANFSYTKIVSSDFLNAMNIRLLAGRDLEERDAVSPDPASIREMNMVVDTQLAANLGFPTPQSAIGQIVYNSKIPVTIVGVVEADMTRLNGVAGAGAGTGYWYYRSFPTYAPTQPVIRIARDNIPATLANIRSVWDHMAPNTPANIRFFEDLFEASYRQQAGAGHLFVLLGGTCFLIASIGLLGIAIHTTTQRRHEIAVRRTLGAGIASIVRLLLTDFSIPVLIGNILAWPLGYLAAQSYLSAFAYRIELSAAPFALSLAITLLIAWAVIIGLVLKAALARPAEVLRHA